MAKAKAAAVEPAEIKASRLAHGELLDLSRWAVEQVICFGRNGIGPTTDIGIVTWAARFERFALTGK